MTRPRALASILLLALAGCRAEKVSKEGPPAEALEALGAYPVESGTYDLVCTIEVGGSHDADVIPVLSEEQADVRARVEVGRRRFVGKGRYLRLPAVEVEPGLALEFDLVDVDLGRDDAIAELVVTVGETWPARQSGGRAALTCFGLSGDVEQRAEALARSQSGVLHDEDRLALGAPASLGQTSFHVTATHCGREALVAAYPELRPALWGQLSGEGCAVELELRNTGDAPLQLALEPRGSDSLRLGLEPEPTTLVLRGASNTASSVALVALAPDASATLVELEQRPPELALAAGDHATLLLRGVVQATPSAARTPGVDALGLERAGTWTWLATR